MIKNRIIKFLLISGLVIIINLLVVFGLGKVFLKKWYLEMLSTRTDDSPTKVIIQSPEKVEVKQDLQIKSVVEQVQPLAIAIYHKKKTGRDILSQLYNKEDLIGYGAILTSDGWLIGVGDFGNLKTNQIVVIYQDEIIEVDQLLFDEAVGVYFLKVKMNNLPVIKFGSTAELITGQQLLAVNQNEVVLTNLSNNNYVDKNSLSSSEAYYRKFLLANNVRAGSMVVNFQGDLIGVVGANSANLDLINFIPVEFLEKSFKNLLTNKEIKYPYLGVHFFDLVYSLGLNDQVAKGLTAGALLYGRGSLRAVEDRSSLFRVLAEGDIITAIDGEKLDNHKTLADLILSKKSHDKIDIEYVQKVGEFKHVVVELK